MKIFASTFFMFFIIIIFSIAQIIFINIKIIEYNSSFLNINIINDENNENDKNENFIINNN